ncbi:MAG: hypothetical protein Q8Q56_03320, partial [Alphaproteobacteria bacterium]|nr:hypothetical protein [Alphaproteobacteria bacterium]
ADVTNKENDAQWTEYLLHKLAPVAEGGLGATTIDISAVALTVDEVTNFMAALNAVDTTKLATITQIKLKISGYGATSLTLTGLENTYTSLSNVIVYTDTGHTGTISLSLFGNNLRAYVETPVIPTGGSTADKARVWTRYLNYQLSGAAIGGANETTVNLSGLSFANQTQLDEFFAGLDAAHYTTDEVPAKARLQNLTLKLASGDFGAASAQIGYTGSAAVINLKSDLNVTVHRNGARNGTNTYDPMVTINFVGAVTGGSTVNTLNEEHPSAEVNSVTNLASTADWLAYLNDTLTAAGAVTDYILDLTGVGFQLAVGALGTQATALFNALEALNPTLKTKINTIKIKLAAGDHTAGLTINPNLAGFTSLASFIVDATGALNGTAQSIVTFNFTNAPESGFTSSAHVTALSSVDLDIADSWGYYLNYLKATSSIEWIDLSARDLYLTDQAITQGHINAFFTALQARTDKASVKDIFIDVQGLVGGTNVNIGSTTTVLTNLTSVVIRSDGTTTFTAAGDVAASDLAVIKSATGTLGADGSISQWKGYLASLLEDADHGGTYVNSDGETDPTTIAINLTADELQVNSLAVLQAIETAINELPARLKMRISAILIKTTNADVNYTTGSYKFGDILAQDLPGLSNLKAVIIESCTTGTAPVFNTAGAFFNKKSISKIVYHTTLTPA